MSGRATITSGAIINRRVIPTVDAPATTPGRAAAASEWTRRAGRYAGVAVENAERHERQRIERRLKKPSRGWTARELVRIYRATVDGERRFREEAEVFTRHGYAPWLETDRFGAPRGGRLLLGATFGAIAPRSRWRGQARRTVTWATP